MLLFNSVQIYKTYYISLFSYISVNHFIKSWYYYIYVDYTYVDYIYIDYIYVDYIYVDYKYVDYIYVDYI